MENDTIRASGSNTLIDIWVDGKIRAICVTRAAIDTYLGTKAGSATDAERCEFVRAHLPQITTAIRKKLRANPSAETVVVEGGELGGAERRTSDPAKSERRKGERRRVNVPVEDLPYGDRRRSDRRKSSRRKSPDSA